MVRQLEKKHRMRRKGMIDVRAALRLIAAENTNALRVVLKNVANRASKPPCSNKKS
ncbi:MAG: hypothetical protein JSW66_14860 [Phycisphaerales bacterium]|nr:MAG: hypothetical protein JSW66_14860 [Phycisphaerales bacterium]